MQLEEACLNCQYWHALKDEEYGRCRRYAPAAYVGMEDTKVHEDLDFIFITHWPETHFSDWCGDMKFNFKTEVPE